MQASSRTLLLFVVSLQGELVSRGRKERDDFFEIRPHSHSSPHGLRQSRPFQKLYPNHQSTEYGNVSFYTEFDNQRGRVSFQDHGSNAQGYPEGIHDGDRSAYPEGRITYHDVPEFHFKRKKPRTWTAKPRPEDEFEGTTKDPAIPENPEGLKDPSLLTGPWEEKPLIKTTEAHFKGINGSVVEAQADTTANLPCVILKRADHETVSWIRMRDHHLITVGRQTYSNDDRFSVTYNRHLHEWTLHIRYVQARDAGEYICQLSTHPPMVFVSTLTITRASSTIEGGPEMHVHEGSPVVLLCSLRQHTQAPEYVFWYHNGTMINFDTDRQVSVEKTDNGSVLTLASVGRTDSGNYTCVPANARSASITLHILLSDAPAAMQVSKSSVATPVNPISLLILFLLLQMTNRIGYARSSFPL